MAERNNKQVQGPLSSQGAVFDFTGTLEDRVTVSDFDNLLAGIRQVGENKDMDDLDKGTAEIGRFMNRFDQETQAIEDGHLENNDFSNNQIGMATSSNSKQMRLRLRQAQALNDEYNTAIGLIEGREKKRLIKEQRDFIREQSTFSLMQTAAGMEISGAFEMDRNQLLNAVAEKTVEMNEINRREARALKGIEAGIGGVGYIDGDGRFVPNGGGGGSSLAAPDPGSLLDFNSPSASGVSGTSSNNSIVGAGNFLSNFGQITAYGSPYWKHGLDVDVKKGDLVPSPFSGTVTYANSGYNGGFGGQVKIKDESGNEIWLSHLDGINVKAGQKIKAGQLIGAGGNTGNVIKGKGGDGSHLDITVVNPQGGYLSPRQVQNFLNSTA